MKKIVFAILFLAFAAFGQTAKPLQELYNYNANGKLKYDSLTVTSTIDTVVFSGKVYNVMIWPIDGDILFKCSYNANYFAEWATVPQSYSWSSAGNEIDSLFLKSSGTVKTNLFWTQF